MLAYLRMSKRIDFAWLENLTCPQSGVSDSPNTQPTDLANSKGGNCSAARWRATTRQAAATSGETSRAEFAPSFGGICFLRTGQYCAATQTSEDSCHAANACDGECNDYANVTGPKKPVAMSNFEQRVMSRFAHFVFSKLGRV
jgi:hypothetical protein